MVGCVYSSFRPIERIWRRKKNGVIAAVHTNLNHSGNGAVDERPARHFTIYIKYLKFCSVWSIFREI